MLHLTKYFKVVSDTVVSLCSLAWVLLAYVVQSSIFLDLLLDLGSLFYLPTPIQLQRIKAEGHTEMKTAYL